MGCREVFRFVDNPESPTEQYQVYKHWSLGPRHLKKMVDRALPYAWKLPRYEPDDFAAAFVCGNKRKGSPETGQGGDVRLMPTGFSDWNADDPTIAFDVEHLYVIWFADGELRCIIKRIGGSSTPSEVIFRGLLSDVASRIDESGEVIKPRSRGRKARTKKAAP